MIVRGLAMRHGRRALAAPVTRSWFRALSTESTTTTTTTTTAASTATSAPGLTPDRMLDSSTPAYKLVQQKPLNDAIEAIPENHRVMRTIKRQTEKLGSDLEVRYLPNEILSNPPSEATLELLMASQTHIGHHKTQWNPANSNYIFGVRDSIHIISLEQTLSHLRRATRVVEEVAYYGGLILFVGNRKGQMDVVVRAAELSGSCHLFQKWTPGFITNRDQILRNGGMHVVNENDQPLSGFEKHLQDRRPLVPDLVVCLNPLENYTMLYECGLASVPTIGIIDTNVDPTWVTYAIPGNDDSLRSVSVIASVLGRAAQRGKRRRLEAAQEGNVTWENPAEIDRFMHQDSLLKANEIAKGIEMHEAQKAAASV